MNDQSKFVEASNQFAFDLFAQITRQHHAQNTLISPLVTMMALTMVYHGARSDTRLAMQEALGLLGIDDADLAAHYAEIMERYTPPPLVVTDEPDPPPAKLERSSDQEYTAADIIRPYRHKPANPPRLEVANGLWLREGMHVEPDFVQRLEQAYQAHVGHIDFSDASAPQIINEWVKEHTGGKIEQIVGDLDPLTRLVLASTVYFKANWHEKFEEEETRRLRFTLLDGSTKQHPIMLCDSRWYYLENSLFQAVRLPYRDEQRDWSVSDLSMHIFLPRPDIQLGDFYDMLTAENWEEWANQFQVKDGIVGLPRFMFSFDLELSTMLGRLGMKNAFDPTLADFTGISPHPPQPIWIDKFLHKTFIAADEEGTEVASAAEMLMYAGGAYIPESRFKMIVDRPFFIVIRDDETGLILFMGTVVEPL